MNPSATKKFQEPAELSNAHPLEDIDLFFKNCIRFARESGSNDFFDASFPRTVCDQARVYPITGDDSQNV